MAGLVTFADVDGDTVTVRTNRGTDAQLGAALTLPLGYPPCGSDETGRRK